MEKGSVLFYLELKIKSPGFFLAFFKKIVDIIEQNIIFGPFNRSSLHFHPHRRYLLGKEHRRRLLWVISFNCVSIVFLKSQRFLAMSTFFFVSYILSLVIFHRTRTIRVQKRTSKNSLTIEVLTSYHYIKASKI